MTRATAQERIAGCVRAELARSSVTGFTLIGLLGLQRTAVYTRLNGKVPFTVSDLYLIADYLDVHIDVLMGDAAPDVERVHAGVSTH